LVEVPFVDTAPVFEDEIIHKGDYMIHVRWNPYLTCHEADVFKVKTIGTNPSYTHIGVTAGKSKSIAVSDAEMLIID
tara:strand:+ start:200 stop:430 length:231 start_codon:yes stop_codon:yes gene_type:complete